MVGSVRELAQEAVQANAQQYMDGTFPLGKHEEARRSGALACRSREQYGGLGLPVFDIALMLEEIAKTCYVPRSTLGEAGVQTRVIESYSPERDFASGSFRKVVSGECILAVCIKTEPHAGTDLTFAPTQRSRATASSSTAQRRHQPRRKISSSLRRSTAGRASRHRLRPAGTYTPGFEVTGTYHTMGRRGSPRQSIRFNSIANCRWRNLVIREDGFSKLLTAFNTKTLP